jgi:hypothetical protein
MASAGDDATATCRHPHWRQALAAIGPGGTCHVSPGAGVPPLVGGLFWQIFSEAVSFDISLVQVVSSVKNSALFDRAAKSEIKSSKHAEVLVMKLFWTSTARDAC